METLTSKLIECLKTINDLEPITSLLESMQGEYGVLNYLYEKSSSPTEISNSLSISKARTTVIINSLIKKDFVTSFADGNDKRKQIVSLTQKGKTAFERKAAETTTFFDDFLMELGESDAIELMMSLEKSIKAIQNKQLK